MDAAVLRLQLAGAGDDVLRLLGGVRVPAEMAARLDLVDDGRGLVGALAAVARENAPSHSMVASSTPAHLDPRELSEATTALCLMAELSPAAVRFPRRPAWRLVVSVDASAMFRFLHRWMLTYGDPHGQVRVAGQHGAFASKCADVVTTRAPQRRARP